ncbi:hypothetical protein Tco_1011145 [Tanacetum coccineum]
MLWIDLLGLTSPLILSRVHVKRAQFHLSYFTGVPAYAPDSLEYAPPSDDDLEPAEAHALSALVLPALLSPKSEPTEGNPQDTDPEDVSEEDPSKEDDLEEEELPAQVALTPIVPYYTLSSEEEIEPFEEDEVAPTPPSPTSPFVTSLSQTRLRTARKSVLPHQLLSPVTLADTTALVASPSLPLSSTHRDPIPEADMPPQKRSRFYSLPYSFEIRESSAAAIARQSGSVLAQGAIDRLLVTLEETDERDDIAVLQARLASTEREVWILRTRSWTAEHEAAYACDAWSFAMDKIRVLQCQRQKSDDRLTRTMARIRRSTTNQIPNNEGGVNQTVLVQLVTQRVANALAAMEASRSSTQEETNRTTTTIRTCSYKEFRSYIEENFSGTEDGDRVKYAACTMLDGALAWWNMYTRTVGINIIAYTQRFQELALLCLEMVTPETRMIKHYIGGLSQNINGNVTSSKPTKIHETISMAYSLMDQVIQDLGEKTIDNKRKWEGNHNNNKNNNKNNNNNYHQNKCYEVPWFTLLGQLTEGKVQQKPTQQQESGDPVNKRRTLVADPLGKNCGNGSDMGHMAKDCTTPARAANQGNQNNQRNPPT